MVVVWGSRLYGRTDEIPGVGHVATRFGHFMFLPIFPMESFFVTEQKGHQFAGIPLKLSSKSVAVGYGFAYSILFFVFGLSALNTVFNPTEAFDQEQIPALVTMMTLGMLSVPAFIATRLQNVRFASYETARELAATVEDPRVQVYVEHHFGKISDEEADQLIQKLEAAASPPSYGAPEQELLYA